jgi:hypothetical protein
MKSELRWRKGFALNGSNPKVFEGGTYREVLEYFNGAEWVEVPTIQKDWEKDGKV